MMLVMEVVDRNLLSEKMGGDLRKSTWADAEEVWLEVVLRMGRSEGNNTIFKRKTI